jgi:23S rRNA (cytosine1962-C5)-methyltransferase
MIVVKASSARLVLQPGRDKSLRHRHPWIFSGAIAHEEGKPTSGDTVAVVAHDGAFLACAAYSAESQIRARAWSFEAADTIDEAFLRSKLAASIARRHRLMGEGDAMRLVHGESDGLPGLIVDRYGETIVVQLLSAGAERWRALWPSALVQLTGATNVYERSDVEVRTLEGLAPRSGPMIGEAPGPARIVEDGIAYDVDVTRGQKTGFYLDQRDNRHLASALADGAEALNCFCYTGGFTLSALSGGAKRVTSLDTSEEALALARHNASLNSLIPHAPNGSPPTCSRKFASSAIRAASSTSSCSIRRSSRRPRSTSRTPRAPTRTSTSGR